MSREELITLLELLQKYKKEEVDSIVKQEPKFIACRKDVVVILRR